jgi:hypothetical protein
LREARAHLHRRDRLRVPLLVRISADVSDVGAVIDGMAEFSAAFVLETPAAIVAARGKTHQPLMLAVASDDLADRASGAPCAVGAPADGYVLSATLRGPTGERIVGAPTRAIALEGVCRLRQQIGPKPAVLVSDGIESPADALARPVSR